ncbi:MAG: zinc metalloprotease HtpX [Moraxellaceae bacterium]|nr:MAG: zinc metalloprotease HtpX [Moraxellaceae bacterium]
MKRIVLFLATNLCIVLVLSISLQLLGVEPFLNAQGINFSQLLIFAAALGMGGAFISLAISKWLAKKSMGVRIIDSPANTTEDWLVNTVRKYAEQTGIGMPEVGIFAAAEANAFATGMNKNNALVAVSEGLLTQMTQEEAEAVIGSIVAELILGVLASVVVMWFSRRREFAADRGGADLAGRQKMIAALERLDRLYPSPLPDRLAAFGISGGDAQGLKRLFMTHPPLRERIDALRELSRN